MLGVLASWRFEGGYPSGVLLLLALIVPGVVSAAEPVPPPVEVTVEPCVRADRAQILALLELELAGAAPAVRDESPAATLVHLRCEDLEEVSVEVRDPLTRKSLARAIDLAGIQPNARARLLALAVAELVTASWMELELRARKTAAPPAPAPPANSTGLTALAQTAPNLRTRQERSPESRLALLMHTRLLGDETPLLGAGLRFAHDGRSQLGFSVDLINERGTRPTRAGTVSLDALSTGVALQYRPHIGRVSTLFGAGARAGIAWIYGRGDNSTLVEERRFAAPWGGPVLTATGSLRVFSHLIVELGLESGYAVASARGRAGDEIGLGLTGLWLGLSLALGYGS